MEKAAVDEPETEAMANIRGVWWGWRACRAATWSGKAPNQSSRATFGAQEARSGRKGRWQGLSRW